MISIQERRKQMPASKAIVLTLGLMAAGGLTSVGCGLQPGRSVITQNGHSDPIMSTAPDSGEYSLFTATSPNATATAKVNKGEALGFKRADDGHLIAVAGDQNFDLPKHVAQAYWKFEK